MVDEKVLLETEATAKGVRLKLVALPNGCVSALVSRRTLVRSDSEGAACRWWIAAGLTIELLIPVEEAVRLIVHLCAFYDPELAAQERVIAAALSELPEVALPPPAPVPVPAAGGSTIN